MKELLTRRLLLLTTSALYFCCAIEGRAQSAFEGGDVQSSASENLGSAVYAARCAACHQGSGKGLSGLFPPLDSNAVVTAEDPDPFIRTLLEGQQGKLIDGVSYALPMPSFADSLTDQELAAVINYVRAAWDNSASAIAADQVANLRE